MLVQSNMYKKGYCDQEILQRTNETFPETMNAATYNKNAIRSQLTNAEQIQSAPAEHAILIRTRETPGSDRRSGRVLLRLCGVDIATA